MTDQTQILEVRYGTFSCRLEGFDDSVGTLRAVVGYFHDLAGPDRFFDLAPQPQDVADMAAWAAEQTDQPLAAQMDGGTLLLEPRDATEDDAAAETTTEAEAEAEAEPDVVAAPVPQTDTATDADHAADDTDEDDSFAARLERIKAVVERAALPQRDEDDETAPAPLILTRFNAADDDEKLNLADFVAEDDLDLRAELAAIDRQIADRATRKDLVEAADATLDRIMSETEQQLNASDTRRQHDQVAHLKAAAAVTAVERDETGADDDADAADDDTFRARNQTVGTAPVPLQLVASLRVEPAAADPRDDASARLRQIAQRVTQNAVTRETFDRFAATHGATDLDEIIEAAAAYIVFVEGQDDFSRPQIMAVAQTASESHIPREDSLRSFGRLLRQNRILKLANGRFQVASDTRFRAQGDTEAQM